jgi:hypothetical protein
MHGASLFTAGPVESCGAARASRAHDDAMDEDGIGWDGPACPTCRRELDVAEVVPCFCANYVAYECRNDNTLVLAPAFDEAGSAS